METQAGSIQKASALLHSFYSAVYITVGEKY